MAHLILPSNYWCRPRFRGPRGGEALPECLSNWPGGAGTKQNWLNFYADMSSFLMGAVTGTSLHIETPVNEAGSGPPFDTDYGTQEAGLSVQYTGGDEKVFGFGAQGLQASDRPITRAHPARPTGATSSTNIGLVA